MQLIIGLGNPGEKYAQTRHNIGFTTLDHWAQLKLGPEAKFSANKKLESDLLILEENQEKIILAKPQTFMNLSGRATQKIISFYNIPAENLLVIQDDLDLPLGKIRFSQDSGPAGHNGIKSIIETINTQNFVRLRIGIATKEILNQTAKIDSADFVLQKFSPEEQQTLEENKKLFTQAIDHYLQNGFNSAANQYN